MKPPSSIHHRLYRCSPPSHRWPLKPLLPYSKLHQLYYLSALGQTCEGDCPESNGTGNQQDSSHCRDHKEKDASVTSRYCHQFSQHN
ncbi:hypothetical protein SLA2020_314960 [Shorea laevis]